MFLFFFNSRLSVID